MLRSLLAKSHLAIVLAGLAMLSYLYSTSVSTSSEGAMIPLAIASDDRVNGELEMFLKIEGMPGNASDLLGKHKGEMDVDSYALEATRGLGASRPTLGNVRITLPAGRASAKLFLQAAGAVKVQRATLAVRKEGASSDFLTWTFTDLFITSFKTVGNTKGDGITDEVVLSFSKVEAAYVPPEGGEPVRSGWDLRTGKSVGY